MSLRLPVEWHGRHLLVRPLPGIAPVSKDSWLSYIGYLAWWPAILTPGQAFLF
jgi:hypothetical protein